MAAARQADPDPGTLSPASSCLIVLVFPAVADPTLNWQGSSIVLYDARRVVRVSDEFFEEAYWRAAGQVVGEASGRGSVIFVRHDDSTWVLRHYHRGGFVGRFISDRYVWPGLERTRAFREWRLLSELCDLALPVPTPIAARVRRSGIGYTADIITEYLDNTRSLESIINDSDACLDHWQRIGRTLRQFHDLGVDHSDLNACNILLDNDNQVYLVDFDKGKIRGSGTWRDGNLRRLNRSLRKVALKTGTSFDANGWQELERSYQSMR
jgi:3-deoxy-D-manno-octulosonic acid kinase